MTLHFHWLHAPRWLANVHVNRAMTLVLGVIGVSLLFGALRVLDVAISGALVEIRPVAMAPAASAASSAPDALVGTEPPAAGVRPVDADFVEVPEATAQAVSL
jgi:hypothetical protein